MRRVIAIRHNNVWRIIIEPVKKIQHNDTFLSVSLSTAATRGRGILWQAYEEALKKKVSPVWAIEYLKVGGESAEITAGIADMLAQKIVKQNVISPVIVELPNHYVNRAAIEHALESRGQMVRGGGLRKNLNLLSFFLAKIIASVVLFIHLIRHGNLQKKLPKETQCILAVHGEWSNRTSHILKQINHGFSPDAIIVIGRLREPLSSTVKRWCQELKIEKLPPVMIPYDIKSTFKAFRNIRLLMIEGANSSLYETLHISLRDRTAMTFRVLLGAVSSEWWRRSNICEASIYYGHAGTGYTTLMERAQQDTGNKTVHVIHGISVGPNFIGFSSCALFRCGFDSDFYSRLGGYGVCEFQPANYPKLQRAKSGLLLLTNFAHPMNPGFIQHGVRDELDVLASVASVASRIGANSQPMLWKPHPILKKLSLLEQEKLYTEAFKLGFTVLPPDTNNQVVAAEVRWTLITPSTVALDLLCSGSLPIVLDWQHANPESAAVNLKTCVQSQEELITLFSRLDRDDVYQKEFQAAWDALRPAAPLDLSKYELV